MFTLPGKSGTYICIYIYITYPLFLGWSRPQFFWQKNKHDHSLGISSSPKNHPIPMDKTLRIVTSSSFRIPRCTKRCRSLGGNLIHSTKVMWFKMDDLESAEKSYSKKWLVSIFFETLPCYTLRCMPTSYCTTCHTNVKQIVACDAMMVEIPLATHMTIQPG